MKRILFWWFVAFAASTVIAALVGYDVPPPITVISVAVLIGAWHSGGFKARR